MKVKKGGRECRSEEIATSMTKRLKMTENEQKKQMSRSSI